MLAPCKLFWTISTHNFNNRPKIQCRCSFQRLKFVDKSDSTCSRTIRHIALRSASQVFKRCVTMRLIGNSENTFIGLKHQAFSTPKRTPSRRLQITRFFEERVYMILGSNCLKLSVSSKGVFANSIRHVSYQCSTFSTLSSYRLINDTIWTMS